MQETGIRNGAFGADKFGFQGLAAVHWNLPEPTLYEHAIRYEKDASIADNGALVAYSGVKTGRRPPCGATLAALGSEHVSSSTNPRSVARAR